MSTYEDKYRVRWFLPICRDCDELCFTPQCNQAMYDEWLRRHEGHRIEHGPEWPTA